MRRFSFLLSSALSLVLATSGAVAFELAHHDHMLSLDETPVQIVSYDLGVLDSLNALDIEVVGVPKSVYQASLAHFNDAPVVGTLFEPDYQALKEFDLDLIFVGSRARAEIPELQKLAPTVEYITDPLKFLQSFQNNTMALARAFGKEGEAAEAMSVIVDNLEELHQRTSGKTALFLFVIRDNVIAHAPGERFGYAYELTGLQSVLPPVDPSAQPPAPRPEPGSEAARKAQLKRAEIISTAVQADPDWLIVLDRGAINGAEKTAALTLAQHSEIGQMRAFKEGNVVYADPNGWYIVTTGLNNLRDISVDLLEQIP